MFRVNEHHRKLAAGYLFPEIARRVRAYETAHPDRAANVIRCGVGDVTEPIPQAVRDAMKRAIDDLGTHDRFRGYGPGTGYEFVREAIVEHDFRARGVEMSIDEVFLSDGSKGDAGSVLEILGPDNRIAVTDPVYPVYVDTNVMAGHTGPAIDGGGYEGITHLPATIENGFVPSPPDAPIDVVYLCYPNNPTGGMIDHERLRRWVDWANETGALILYDVAYEAFIRDPSLPRSIYEIDGARTCAMEFHSFSKNGGFTGVRCGYTVCPKELEGVTSDGERLSLNKLWTRRWNTRSNGVSWPVQCGAAALYTEDGRAQVGQLVDFYMENARLLREGCERTGLRVFGGEHAPYVWVTCPEGTDSWGMFDRMLEEANVVVTPGAGFGRCGEGFFRVSAFNSRANVETVCERLQTVAAALAAGA